MIKFVKSLIAANAHMKSMRHWANLNRADALVQISKAIKFETNEAIQPKHLVFKAEIEVVLGKHNEARLNFEKANTIIKQYPKYWSKRENTEIVNRVTKALSNSA